MKLEKFIHLIPFISRVFELMFSFWIFRSTIYFMFLNFWLTYTWFLFSSSSSDSSSDDSSDDESSSSSSDSSGDESDVNILEEAPPPKVTKPGISPAKEFLKVLAKKKLVFQSDQAWNIASQRIFKTSGKKKPREMKWINFTRKKIFSIRIEISLSENGKISKKMYEIDSFYF